MPTPSAAAELAFPDVREMLLHIDHLTHRCTSALVREIGAIESRFELARSNIERFSPINRLGEKIARLELVRERLDKSINERYSSSESAFKLACARLEGVNPLAVLSRGYSAIENGRGEIIASIRELKVGERVEIRMSDGRASAVIDEVNGNEVEI